MGIAGVREAYPRGAWWLRFGKVRVVFGPAIPAERVAELSQKGREKEFVELIRGEIQQCLSQANRWRDEGIPPGVGIGEG